MQEPFNDYGLSAPVLLAGFMGGVVRALSRGYTSFRTVIASPVCGALCAGYLTKPLIHYVDKVGFPLPPIEATGNDTSLLAAGFVVGICGMWISDFVFLQANRLLKIPSKEK